MRNESTDLYAAKENHYLRVKGRSTDALENAHYKWCRDNSIPYVKVWEANKYASVSINADTTSCILSEAGQNKIVELAGSYGLKLSNVGCGKLYCNIEKVPNEQAEALAKDMLMIFEMEKIPVSVGRY